MYEIMWTDNIASLPRKSTFEGVLYLNDGSTKQYRKWTVPYNEESGQVSFRVCNPNTTKEVKLVSLEQREPLSGYKPDINIADDIGIITFDIETMRARMGANINYNYYFKGVEKDTLNVVNVYFTVSVSATRQLICYYNDEITFGLYFRLYDQKYYDWDSDRVKTLPKLNPVEFVYKPSGNFQIKDIDHVWIETGPYDNHETDWEDTDDGIIIRDTVSIDSSYKDPDNLTADSYYSYKMHVYDTDGNHYLGALRYLADTRKTTSFNAFVLHNGTGDMAFDDVDTSDPNDNRKRSSNIVNMDGTEEILMFIFTMTDKTDSLGAEYTITRADGGTGYDLGAWTLSVDYSKCSKGISKLVFQGMDRYNNIRTLKLATVIK